METREMQISGMVLRTIESVHKQGKLTKAGIWQATDLFRDEMMFVRRNLDFTFDLNGTDLQSAFHPDLPWAEDHFQERISGEPTNPGETYKYWPYANFKDGDDPYQDGKKFSHTYQERFWPRNANRELTTPDRNYHIMPNMGIRYNLGDLNDVIQQLKDNPLTRQAWLPIFFPEDTGAVHGQRVPCTLGYYFWVEDERVHCNYVIRSCDILRHFRNDLYLTGRLLHYIAEMIQTEAGELNFYCFNLHLFQNDLYALQKREKPLWKNLSNE